MYRANARHLSGLLLICIFSIGSWPPVSAGGRLPETNISKQISKMDCKELKLRLKSVRADENQNYEFFESYRANKKNFEKGLRASNEKQSLIAAAMKSEKDSAKKRSLRSQLRKAKAEGRKLDKSLRILERLHTDANKYLRNSQKDKETIKKWLDARRCK